MYTIDWAAMYDELAGLIDSASKERQDNFPHGNYKEADATLVGLLNGAVILLPDTRNLGNEETAAELRRYASELRGQP
jgi:hypothetical protein